MKKIALLLLISLTLFGADKYENDFKIGALTQNIQDSEGGGLYLAYRVYNDIMIETAYNIAYIRGVSVGSDKESWNEFTTQRLGLRWYLADYADNKIKLFASFGLEHLYDNDIASDTSEINRYALAGVEFEANSWLSISFSMGSTGKGADADALETSPNFAHGFNSIMAVEVNF